MSMMGDTRIGLLTTALDGLAQRQQAIAGNIANVDTPGYKRKDVDFEASLRASVGRANNGMAQVDALPSSSLLSMSSSSAHTSTVRNDGNNVDIDYEMTQLAETSLRYELLSQAAGARFTELQNIIGKSA